VPDTIFGAQLFAPDVAPEVWNPMASAGVRYVRTRVMWEYVEPVNTSPPTYYWSGTGLDRIFADLRQVGFTPIVVVYGHPSWAASRSCGPIDRVPLSRYGEFMAALVERYDGDGTDDAPGSPRVGYWEIGNEPDFNVDRSGGEPDYGSCFGGQAAAYGRYLRTAYLAARSSDSTAKVLFGGVAYDRFYNKSGYTPTGPFDYPFVSDVFSWLHANHGGESAWPFADWIAVHVYNDYRNAWDGSQPYDQELRGKVKHFRANQLLRVGEFDLRTLPLAITEASLISMPSDSYTERSEDLQAVYPAQVLVRSMASGLKSLIWYSAEDHAVGACTDPYAWIGVGLLKSLRVYEAAQACGGNNPIPDYHVSADHESKAAHASYGVVVRQLDGVSYTAQLSPAETGSTQIEAYRLTRSGGGSVVAAFTDNGERLGRRGYPPVERTMTFSASNLPGWTGSIAVTDHLGNVTHLSGTSIPVTIRQAPVFVEPE
jgi:hypothetical protein